LDSDDIARKDRLARQVDFLEKNPEYGIVGSWLMLIDKTSKDMGVRKVPIHDEEIKGSFYFRNPIGHPSLIMRRSCVNKT
jgi:hypothetical protein